MKSNTVKIRKVRRLVSRRFKQEAYQWVVCHIENPIRIFLEKMRAKIEIKIYGYEVPKIRTELADIATKGPNTINHKGEWQ